MRAAALCDTHTKAFEATEPQVRGGAVAICHVSNVPQAEVTSSWTCLHVPLKLADSDRHQQVSAFEHAQQQQALGVLVSEILLCM